MSEDIDDLSPQAFAEAVKNNPKGMLLDVRTESEYRKGHLPGALNIDVQSYDFEEQIDNLDAHTPYFLYCRSGNRSRHALRVMKNKGFEKVYHLAGGILAWDAMEGIV